MNILLALTPIACIAQKQGNIWYFGRYAGLDFNSGTPVPLPNGQTYSPDGTPVEGTAVISDSSGSLLFYTNGMKIWNKNHQVMPNGDSLLGHWSSTQSSLILPQPGSSRYFYVFTTDAFYIDDLKYGFRYSVVDIYLDNCFGDIIPTQKNIKLLDTVAEKVTAVRHTNGVDYWVITHKYYSDAFYVYHLSSSGIIDTVISHTGSTHPDTSAFQGVGASIGQLKASPNGQKLVIVNGNSNPCIAEYFDFNKSTGVVSNGVSIQTNPIYNYYGASFSSDNSKLYISCTLNSNGVYQFDLNAGGGNPDSVKASKKQIVANGGYFGMQLGNDGKIYLAKTVSQYLSIINNPNGTWLNCNYQDSAVYLNGDTSNFGLPNFVDSYDYSNTAYDCEVGLNEFTNTNNIILGEPRPNPNNGKTEIDYYIPVSVSNAEIIFTDLLGRIINKTQLVSGYGTVAVDTQDLPNGTYTYSLIADGKVIGTKKMVRNK